MPRRRRLRLTSRKVKRQRPGRSGNADYQARNRELHRRKRHLEAVEGWKEDETKRLEEAVRRRAKSGKGDTRQKVPRDHMFWESLGADTQCTSDKKDKLFLIYAVLSSLHNTATRGSPGYSCIPIVLHSSCGTSITGITG